MLQETQIKIVAAFALLVVALIFGFIPLCVYSHSSMTEPKQRARLRRAVGWLNAFAGGVFMGIALLHLLPEARRMLMDAFKMEGMMYHFNWAELVAASGFFLIVFVEQVIYICQEKLCNNDEGTSSEETAFARQDGNQIDAHTDRASPQPNASTESKAKAGDSKETMPKSVNDDIQSSLACTADHTPPQLPKHLTTLRVVILLVSLSLHSVFEGLAIGLQLTRKDVIDIFIAIAFHKGIEAFTISVSFVQTYTSSLAKTLYCFIFALMSPLGVAIGIPVALSSRSQDRANVTGFSLIVNAILQALATGTFMFVTFIEILPNELNAKKDGLLKFACVVMGFAAITTLNAFEHHT